MPVFDAQNTMTSAGVVKAFKSLLGPPAQVAIYTEHFEHLSLSRKMLLRMRSWQNYVFLEGH
jgi:hypothetical protein